MLYAWPNMRLLKVIVPAVLVAVSSFASAQALQSSPTKIDVSKLGPQVGEQVPDFLLVDQTGQRRTLQSVLGPNGGMLVFVRSADW